MPRVTPPNAAGRVAPAKTGDVRAYLSRPLGRLLPDGSCAGSERDLILGCSGWPEAATARCRCRGAGDSVTGGRKAGAYERGIACEEWRSAGPLSWAHR